MLIMIAETLFAHQFGSITRCEHSITFPSHIDAISEDKYHITWKINSLDASYNDVKSKLKVMSGASVRRCGIMMTINSSEAKTSRNNDTFDFWLLHSYNTL